MNSANFCGRTRREFLCQAGNGFFGTAMAYMLARDGFLGSAQANAPAVPATPAGRAKACIFLFMAGGPSHVDTFDPKPTLTRLDGQNHQFPTIGLTPGKSGILKGSPFRFPKQGKSGLPISELFPELGSCADDMAILRGSYADSHAHGSATLQMNTGMIRQGFPSIGSWAYYGLGTGNQNLPGFVVIVNGSPYSGAQNWSSAFMPARFQGTVFGQGRDTIANIRSAGNVATEEQRRQIDLLNTLNERHLASAPQNSELAARIASYELAFRMQAHAPEATDLTRESTETLQLYGIGSGKPSDSFGRSCLTARRLVERGVRFVQLFHANWDTHGQNDAGHQRLCGQTDRPIAGLLKDLKRMGLLESTIVVWAGEFGRTPFAQKPGPDAGRDHHPTGFTTWLAGGGIKGGIAHGGTDEFGYAAVENRTHVHDLHATILHQFGLDHERLTYRYNGRDYRLTDVEGHVIREIASQG